MKHLAKFAAMALALGLWSCSDDLPDQQKDGEKGEFFATITIQLPSANGSRSQTGNPTDPDDPNNHYPNWPAQSTNGFEVGLPEENAVQNLLIVLAGINDNGYYYLTSAQKEEPTTENPDPDADKKNAQTYYLTFTSESLLNYLGENTTDNDKKDIYLFAYCNPPLAVANEPAKYFQTDGSFFIYDEPDLTQKPIRNGITQPDKFLMTNALICKSPFTRNEVLAATDEKTALNFGTVYVERVACRFDFKNTEPETAGLAPNTFPISFENQTYANVTVTGLALFNEAKEFYMFPQIYDKTQTATSLEVCGYERPDSWVKSFQYDFKKGYSGADDQNTYILSENLGADLTLTQNNPVTGLFYFPTAGKKAPQDFYYSMPSNLPDTDESTQDPDWTTVTPDYENYYVWQYATENTIPTVDEQLNGISTGIYIQAELSASSATNTLATSIADAIKDHELIFGFRDDLSETTVQGNTVPLNVMIGSAKDLLKYVNTLPNSPVKVKFDEACTAGLFTVNGDNITVNVTSDYNNTFKKYGFYCWYPTIGKDSKEHYYVYYPYYNRHNDNGNNNVMAQMEFATVRNNVYKLRISNISRIGLPGDVPPDPGTPDEGSEVYIKVECQILDWVVRINDMAF